MKKERSNFVQRMEHEAITPHDDGATERTHGEDVVDLREDKDGYVKHEAVTTHHDGATQRTQGEDVVDLREDKDGQ